MLKNLLLASAGLACMLPALAWSQASPELGLHATRYDLGGRIVGTIGPDPDGSGPLKYPATRTTFDGFGNVAKVEVGQLSTWKSEDVLPSSWSASEFSISKTVEYTYDDLGRMTSEVVADGTSDKQVTQYTYNYLSTGWEVCAAVRMSRVLVSGSACSLGSQSADGPDRITRTEYNSANLPVKIQKGVGTDRQQDYATYTYAGGGTDLGTTTFGKPWSVKDANGNLTSYTYSTPLGLLERTYFPSAANSGVYNTGDYEENGYDANGNRTSLRRRDGRMFGFHYDALNRLDVKTVPDGCAPLNSNDCLPASATRDVYYGYDLVGHRTYARFDSSANAAEGVSTEYNGLGELTAQTISMSGFAKTLSYGYDARSTQTTLSYPDNVTVTTRFDDLDRAKSAEWSSPSVAALNIMTITYNAAGLRQSIQRGSSTTAYEYGSDASIKKVTNYFYDEYGDVVQEYAYNAAGQVKSRNSSNNAYEFLSQGGSSKVYTHNGLNQYVTAAGASFQYDLRGNLTYDGSVTYKYDAENRLISTNSGVSLVYDPLGRLFQIGGGGSAVTRFLYDEDDLVAEYDESGAMQHRYIHTPYTDETIAWLPGSALTCANARFFHTDRQGSIIAHADCTGVRTAINTYDEYGFPGNANQGRFRYTGQVWLSEIGAYHYKARIYSATLGRFLQTDPIGYEDGLNWYAYVGNDPLNRTDPTGQFEIGSYGKDGRYYSPGERPQSEGKANGLGDVVKLTGGFAAIVVAPIAAVEGGTVAITAYRSYRFARDLQKVREYLRDWTEKPNSKGEGSRFEDPKDAGNRVRVDKGDPESNWPSQQGDHVVEHIKGTIRDKDDNIIQAPKPRNAEEAHQPLSDWLRKRGL